MMKKYCLFFVLIAVAIFFVFGLDYVQAATLTVSPSSGTYEVGDTVSLNILLDTEDVDTRGVDVHYLNYDPSLLTIIDADSAVEGIQISDGGLYSNTQLNAVDPVAGTIDFSHLLSKLSNCSYKVPYISLNSLTSQ